MMLPRYGYPRPAVWCALTAAIYRRGCRTQNIVIHGTVFDGSDGFRMHAMLTAYSPVVQNAPDGKLWFAHHDGVSVIDPHHLRLNTILPPVHIEQITANGKTLCCCRRFAPATPSS